MCLVWNMLSMRCSGYTPILILSEWSCPGGIPIGELEQKDFQKQLQRTTGFNYTWNSSREKKEKVDLQMKF